MFLYNFCQSFHRFRHYSAQASYFAAFRGIRDTKIEKSRGIQDFLFDVKRVLDSTTVLN